MVLGFVCCLLLVVHAPDWWWARLFQVLRVQPPSGACGALGLCGRRRLILMVGLCGFNKPSTMAQVLRLRMTLPILLLTRHGVAPRGSVGRGALGQWGGRERRKPHGGALF